MNWIKTTGLFTVQKRLKVYPRPVNSAFNYKGKLVNVYQKDVRLKVHTCLYRFHLGNLEIPETFIITLWILRRTNIRRTYNLLLRCYWKGMCNQVDKGNYYRSSHTEKLLHNRDCSWSHWAKCNLITCEKVSPIWHVFVSGTSEQI